AAATAGVYTLIGTTFDATEHPVQPLAAPGLVPGVIQVGSVHLGDQRTYTFNPAAQLIAVIDLTPPVVTVGFSPNGWNGWFTSSTATGSLTVDDTITGGRNITTVACTNAVVGALVGTGTPHATAPLSVSGDGS